MGGPAGRVPIHLSANLYHAYTQVNISVIIIIASTDIIKGVIATSYPNPSSNLSPL